MTLLAIPLVSGLVGWGTNALAIRMLFSPLRRRGIGPLGWQGILPANAERMARICVRLMTQRLLNVQGAFERLDAERVAELLGPTLERHAVEIVEEIISTRYPKVWETLPNRLRERARERLRAEIPSVVQRFMDELREDLPRYLDIEGLVVQAFANNRALLNQLFWACGGREFRFIARSGLLFGGLFGALQAVVWAFVQPGWFLPATGLLVGWATNWLALKMVFQPREPRKLGPIRWQGLFLRRQQEVSEAYAAFFAQHILTPPALIDAVLRGAASDRLMELLQRYVTDAVDSATGAARPVVQLSVGTEAWRSLKADVGGQLSQRVPGQLRRLHDYAEDALDLETDLCQRLQALPPEDFEQVLRPVFQEDEATLIAVGAALGGVAGVIQWLLVA